VPEAGLSKPERAALCDLFEAVGPDAPTLCEGWTTLDLAAHLVVRERRPDTGPGLIVPIMAGWTERVRMQATRRGFDRLVNEVRSGPPRYSPLSLLDETVNGMEFFIHHEDVRRAQPGWEPRDLSPEAQQLVWKRATTGARLMMRKAPVGVVLQRPDGTIVVAKRSQPSVTVVGPPAEIALFASGRQASARVELQGDVLAVNQLKAAPLGL
jgi:uncharacterized protein (TIGR03085 family)